MKPVLLTNPAEIASAERNGFGDLIAWQQDGYWLANHDDLAEWREKQKQPVSKAYGK